MKKIFAILLAGMMMFGVLAGCQDQNGTDEPVRERFGNQFRRIHGDHGRIPRSLIRYPRRL